MNGGYIIIDFGDLELTSESKQTISGIYKQVDLAYKTGKPILAAHCTLNDELLSPVEIMVSPSAETAGNYIATSSIYQIEIDDDDGATITSLAGGGGGGGETFTVIDFNGTDIYGGGSLTGLYEAVGAAVTAGNMVKATNVVRDTFITPACIASVAGAGYEGDEYRYMYILDKFMTIASDDTFTVL